MIGIIELIIICGVATVILGLFIISFSIMKDNWGGGCIYHEQPEFPPPEQRNIEPPTPPQPVPIENDEKLTVHVTKCARCGKDHPRMTFIPLRSSPQAAGLYTHWAVCPACGEPILMYGVNDFC